MKTSGWHLMACMGVLALACSVATAADITTDGTESLCSSGDHIYFTCQTKNKKVISLCGKGAAEDPDYIYYRFGRKQKIELEFPDKKDRDSRNLFSYNSYSRYQTNYTAVSFRRGAYEYLIYKDYVGDDPDKKPETSYGINAGKADSQVNIPCASAIKSDLYPLSSVLHCDAEVNELGCSN
jgi:hypothetical protein